VSGDKAQRIRIFRRGKELVLEVARGILDGEPYGWEAVPEDQLGGHVLASLLSSYGMDSLRCACGLVLMRQTNGHGWDGVMMSFTGPVLESLPLPPCDGVARTCLSCHARPPKECCSRAAALERVARAAEALVPVLLREQVAPRCSGQGGRGGCPRVATVEGNWGQACAQHDPFPPGASPRCDELLPEVEALCAALDALAGSVKEGGR